MKKDGPVLANLLVDGILPEDMQQIQTPEPGVKRTLKKTFPARGTVLLDGQPLAGATVTFHPADPTILRPVRADGNTAEDGSFLLSTYTAGDGAPATKYKVTVVSRRADFEPEGKPFRNRLPERYSKTTTSGLEVEVTEGENDFRLELKSN
jgi:hypothetical protein